MTTETITLSSFLLARIAEDEAAAKAATDSPWWYDPTKWNSIDHEESVFAGTRGLRATTVASTGPGNDPQSMADAAHIARHDPARVLAECAAKRAVMEEHQPTSRDPQFEYIGDPSCCTCGQVRPRRFPCATIRALAAVYSDHPSFREEWCP